jgi:hypothetical protein
MPRPSAAVTRSLPEKYPMTADTKGMVVRMIETVTASE